MKRAVILLGLAAALVVVSAAPADAQFIRIWGAGSRAQAMGQAQVAITEDYGAAFYNPAALGQARRALGLQQRDLLSVQGFQYTSLDLFVNGQNQELRDVFGLTIGSVAPLARNVTLGIAGFTPTSILTIRNKGGTLPKFEMYEGRAASANLFVGLGIDLTRQLSIGAGILPTFNINAGQINVDPAALAANAGGGNFSIGTPATDLNPVSDIEVYPSIDFAFSAHFRVNEKIRLGVAYQQETFTEFFLPIFIPDGIIEETKMDIQSFSNYFPQQLAFGIGVDPVDNVTVAFDYVWQDWSEYIGGSRTTSTNHDFRSELPDFKTQDIWIPRIGVEVRRDLQGGIIKDGQVAVRMGYSFQESPFPPATGDRVTLIDNDVHMYSAGVGVSFPYRNFKLVKFDIHGQFHDLVKREHVNLERNPAILVSDGWLYNVGFIVTFMI